MLTSEDITKFFVVVLVTCFIIGVLGLIVFLFILRERLYQKNHCHIKIQCPYCGKQDANRILASQREINVLGKIGKQWQCNNCKSYF